jgi:Zn-dependent protease with chaperone function
MWRGSTAWRLQALQLGAVVPLLGPVIVAILLLRSRITLGGSAPRTVIVGRVEFAYPAANLAALLLLAIAGLGAVIMLRAVRCAVAEVRAYRRCLASLRIVGPLHGHRGVYVFREPSPAAFCAGLLRPRIYVSTGALRRLKRPQLGAVIAHETRHRRARDPLRLLVARIAAGAALVLPLGALVAQRLVIVTELSADRAAVAASDGDRRALAGALLHMSGGAVDSARVDALAGRHPDLRLPSPLVIADLAAVSVLGAGLWVSLRAARFQASLALPGLSSKPCILALAAIPLTASLVARTALARLRRQIYDMP